MRTEKTLRKCNIKTSKLGPSVQSNIRISALERSIFVRARSRVYVLSMKASGISIALKCGTSSAWFVWLITFKDIRNSPFVSILYLLIILRSTFYTLQNTTLRLQYRSCYICMRQHLSLLLHICICCGSILSLVQFLFVFVLYSLSYITVYKNKLRKIKIKPRIKLNHNICIFYLHYLMPTMPSLWIQQNNTLCLHW